MKEATSYTLAPQGCYSSFQGEGALSGVPMVFCRLAGCSVGCSFCDTDYSVASRSTAVDIAARCTALAADLSERWVWVTGGEPADRDLLPLISALKSAGLLVAVATSGHKPMPPRWVSGIDWLSVSPHDPAKWIVRHGQELKLVPGLAGHGFEAFVPLLAPTESAFGHYFAQPCNGIPGSQEECEAFARRMRRPRFRLGSQAHGAGGWNLP